MLPEYMNRTVQMEISTSDVCYLWQQQIHCIPAWADLMNMKRFNGKCACHLCKSEGVGCGPNNIHRYWAKGTISWKKGLTRIRFNMHQRPQLNNQWWESRGIPFLRNFCIPLIWYIHLPSIVDALSLSRSRKVHHAPINVRWKQG